ncbi:efflux RND transporter permease subunit [Alteribacillus iranensis]|uniref:Hydrophobic/amphiphilic exporter-1, HAE1 family n=1 Tax=Alteribacillus iranensis TaxID=930128 RepID=A0A1I2DGA3_9BACI|nr:efflux RND transporter permease subunit [Alteribacillus iranensis]SFE79489.1 hydrophobic/amphiphilic exporter-1, HAE1 family [Alteribacillus iranensis]
MKLTRLSIRRPKMTIVGMILFILLGVVSLTNLPLQLFPEIDPPVGAVVSSYPGASPEEVEEKVTKPLEEELSTLPGLNRMTSTSEEGMTLILLEFSWDSTLDEVEQDIITSMNVAQIEDEANDPSFLKFDPSMMGMTQMAITSNNQEIQDFQGDVEDFQGELERIDGIANVDQTGGVTERYEVNLHPDELETYNLSQEDIVNAIQSHEIALPGGTVETDDHSLSTRVLHTISNEEELNELVVGANPSNGNDISLSDVAEVELAPPEQTAITRANQKPALQLTAMKETDANAASVSSTFNETLDELLNKEEYEDLSVTTFYDEGEYIQQSIDSVTMALVLGGVFAMVVLFFFLRNLKTPLIIGIAIPFSVIVTFGFLYFTDVSLNLMTLGGLALGIGMLVDNAIVVIENIYRHLSMGYKPKEAAAEGTKEVGGAITASTLTTVSVFLPIVFISGIVGNIFTEFALAVAFSLIASLFVALTVVPMLASRILTLPTENKEKDRQSSTFMKGLDRSIKWVLGHRAVTLLVTISLLAIGGAGIAVTGVNFLPATDEGFFTIDVEMENGTKLENTTGVIEDIENILDDESLVQDYMAVIGSSEDTTAMGGPSGSNEAQLFVTMIDMEQRDASTLEFVEDIEDEITGVERNADISLSTQAAVGGGEANTVVFTMSDSDLEHLNEAVKEVQSDLEDENVVRDVETSREENVPEMQVRIDDEAARNNGLVPAEIAQTVNNVTRGQTATSIQTDNNETYDVVVKYADDSFSTVEDLRNLSIQNANGEYITLDDVAVVEEGEGPAVINRLDQEPSVEFTVSYSTDTNLNDMSQLIEQIIEDADLEDSTTYSFTGEQELLQDAINSLVFAFLLALLFIYLVMAGQFESFKYPFVVMFSVPLVVIGVMIALTVTQTPLSVTVFIGLIVLAGIVVNNAIVLVDYINQMKEKGMPSREAIVEGVRQRTRPILMTAITTILGVLPLSLGIGEGTEIQQPMGIAVIGGLISSTFLTLFVVPVLYSFLDKETRTMNKRFVTPDGQVIYPHEIEKTSDKELEKKEEKVEISREEKEEERKEETNKESDREETQDKEEKQDKSIQDLSKDEIISLLERIVDHSKSGENDRGKRDDKK